MRYFFVFLSLLISQCKAQETPPIQVGAERTEEYLPMLQNKRVGVLVNHTSVVQDAHLVDFLIKKGINVVSIFTPEHGFKGTADAGEKVENSAIEDIPVYSLYGKQKKPTAAQLNQIDILIFDIQDVGARFYTYISSMHYAMEACAENHVPFLILDRPNPNGHYIDGPILDTALQSFVGMHPIPIVHGLTVGELALMIKGENWIKNAQVLDITVVPCNHYSHDTFYELPIKPSPNLPNIKSILLYPTLCLFEGTNVSIGRGTNKQFQLVGHPSLKNQPYSFTPVPKAGAMKPKLENQRCHGIDFSQIENDTLYQQKKLNIALWLDTYAQFQSYDFFIDNNFFDKLAGTTTLKKQIMAGATAEEIRSSWQAGLNAYKKRRAAYLLYP